MRIPNAGSAVVALLLMLAAAVISACSGGSAHPTPTQATSATSSAATSPARTPSAPPTTTPTRTPVPRPTATPTPFVIPTPRSGLRADGSRSAIALTFDTDGDLGYTAGILGILEQAGVHASFAVTGEWAQRYPQLLQRIVADGDTVMNHSWDHPDFTKLTTEQRLSELQRTEDAVEAAAGISTKPYFRPPYGALNDAVRADVAKAGYAIVRWNIDPKGWSGKSGEQVQANVYENARDRGVVLFHVYDAGDYAALGPIISTLGNAGYRFVTIAELYPPPTPTATPTPAASATPAATATPTHSPTPTVTRTPLPGPPVSR